MQGTSAHLEYIGPKDRKYKKDCIYNKDNICTCGKTRIYLSKCAGRMICGFYEDSEKARKELELKKANILAEFEELVEIGRKRDALNKGIALIEKKKRKKKKLKNAKKLSDKNSAK